MVLYMRNLFHNTKVLVHIFVCVFAIASWIDINGMWAELPLMTQAGLPEGWNLPSYLIIISQVGNLGPLLFGLISYLAPQTKPKLEKVVSFTIIVISMVASLLIAFFWKRTTVIGGTEHSTAFLALSFFLALGDCTSSLSFYAFMAHMKVEYMPALFIGEGLSGLVPALIALGQGAGEINCNGTQQLRTEPNFSVQTYFIILSAIIAMSAISFLLLNFWGYCKSEIVGQQMTEAEKLNQGSEHSRSSYGALGSQESVNSSKVDSEKSNVYKTNPHAGSEDGDGGSSLIDSETSSARSSTVIVRNESMETTRVQFFMRSIIQLKDMPLWKFFFLLSLVLIINMTATAFLPSIQIYSVLPYGLEYYHLTTTLPQIANPVACFLTLFVLAERVPIILGVTVLGEACVAYIIYVAAMSPDPPLKDDSSGGSLAVALWVILIFLLTYGKVCVAGVMRKQGRNALIWVGAATQTGALIGAIVGFLLVNEFKVFIDAPFCQ